jgi:hypothetical protein
VSVNGIERTVSSYVCPFVQRKRIDVPAGCAAPLSDGGAAVHPTPSTAITYERSLPVRRPIDATDRGNDAVSHHEES